MYLAIGRAADHLKVEVGDAEAFHGSGEEGRRAAAPGTGSSGWASPAAVGVSRATLDPLTVDNST